MKRFLLAALLALTIHGLFFGFVPRPIERRAPKKPHKVTISLVSYRPAKPSLASRPARITEDRPSLKRLKKKEEAVIKPLLAKKTPEAPQKILSAKKEVVKSNKKTMPPQEKRKKPLKSVTEFQKNKTEPEMRPKIPRKAVMASLVPEKKKTSPLHARATDASRPTKVDVALPIEEPVKPEEHPALFPDVPGGNVVERGTETALIPPAKTVREARPAYKVNPPPPYPKRAKRRGYEGTVILEVLVDRNGRVKELRIQTSSGHRVLDRAAMKSVKGWLFEPGMMGDEKVDMWVRVPVRFELRGG